MPKQKCRCGAKYSFPESAIGKRAKCAQCGAAMTLRGEEEQGPIPIAGDGPDLTGEMATAVARPSAASAGGFVPPFIPPTPIIEKAIVEEAPRGYAGALLAAFTFPRSPHNIIMFVMIWFLLFLAGGVLPAAGCLGLIGMFVIEGWFASFKFNLIVEAAAGETALPDVTLTEGVLDGIIVPFFRWIGSWLLVLSPMLVTAAVLQSMGRLGTTFSFFYLYKASFVDLLRDGSPELLALGALGYAGMFAWPMAVLCVALGGFGSFSRPDLIIVTAFRTFPAYLLTVLIVIGVDVLLGLLTEALGPPIWTEGFFVKQALTAAAHAYLAIAAMSAIGLYYRHFKDRFAWSWE